MLEKELKKLNGKRLAFLGLGAENQSLIKFLLKEGIKCRLAICDPKPAAELGDRYLELVDLVRKRKAPVILMFSGQNYDEHLADFDIVFRSPGYPLFSKNLIKAQKAGVEISSAMKMFFKLCPTKNIIGVTGSKGKGTTSSLIYEILKEAATTTSPSLKRRGVFLGGNIGVAPFSFFSKIKGSSFVVLELSSFQLEDLDISPKISVVTNIYKEHLAPADPDNPNYHKSPKAYWEAKANIFAHQNKRDYLVINEKLKTKKEKTKSESWVIYFSKSNLPSKLKGDHNKENVAAALAVAKILKIDIKVTEKAIKNFKGLPHRLELVLERDGIKYFDDSFATVPEVSVIALKSFDAPIILLAGGADKGSDFKNFAKEIEKRVKFLILFKGEGTKKLKAQLPATNYQLKIREFDKMKDALVLVKKIAKPGDIVLLSTGCASFGCFKNYKERGDQFKKEVLKKT